MFSIGDDEKYLTNPDLNPSTALKKTAFGELLTDQLTPVIQIQAQYDNLNTQQLEQITATNGTITTSNAVISLNTSTDIYSYATLRTVRSIRYRTGQGVLARFTAIFDSNAVANSTQLAGMGKVVDGLYFGYNGVDFGVVRQYNGAVELRQLEITTAENSITTAVITLNDTAFNVSLTNAGGSKEFTAFEIASSSAFDGVWDVVSKGVYVIFSARSDGAKSGSYSYSNGGGASAGTLSQLQAGVTKSQDWTYQSNWNIDRMDGTGPSGQTLDVTKGNVFEIYYQYLGYGAITFAIEDGETGVFQPVHRIQYANKNTSPTFIIPTFKMLFAAASLGSTTALTMKVVSIAAFNQGIVRRMDPVFALTKVKAVTANTETNIIVLKNSFEYNSTINQSELFLRTIFVAVEGTKTVQIRIYKNGVVSTGSTSDYPNYTVVNSQSTALYDTNSTTISSGILILSVVLSKSGSQYLDLNSLDIILGRGETLTITGESSANADVNVSINWVEDL